jgi:hypothetical protein
LKIVQEFQVEILVQFGHFLLLIIDLHIDRFFFTFLKDKVFFLFGQIFVLLVQSDLEKFELIDQQIETLLTQLKMFLRFIASHIALNIAFSKFELVKNFLSQIHVLDDPNQWKFLSKDVKPVKHFEAKLVHCDVAKAVENCSFVFLGRAVEVYDSLVHQRVVFDLGGIDEKYHCSVVLSGD